MMPCWSFSTAGTNEQEIANAVNDLKGSCMTYLRYSASIERPETDEQKTIDGIIKGMTQQSETVEKRERHAVRASHAKSSACVIGELTIADDLPPELAQGLFARAG